jgi:uncharacterized protein YfaS (alpha-2-macroglobulin family)
MFPRPFVLAATAIAVFGATIVAPGCGKPAPAPAPQPAAPAPAPETPAPAAPAPVASTPAPAPAPTTQPLRVLGQYPLPGDPLNDRFILYFNQPIAQTLDSAGNPLAAVATNPPVPLTVTVGSAYLAAQVDSSKLQRPATYEVVFSPALRATSGATLDGQTTPIRFNVPEPNGAVATGMSVAAKTDAELRLRLKFNVAMNLNALKDFLRVTDASGGALPVALAPIEGSTDMELTVTGAPRLPVSVSVFPGAPDATGLSPVRGAASFSYPDATNGTMTVTGFWKVAGESTRLIAVLSPPMDPAVAKQALIINDATGQPVDATIAPTPNVAGQLMLDLPQGVSLPVSFRFPAGTLSADATAMLKQDYTFQYPDAEQLKVTEAYWKVDEYGESAITLTFSGAVSSESVKTAAKITPKEGGDALRLETSSGNTNSVRIRLLNATPEMKEVLVEIAPGLEGGKLAVMKDRYSQALTRQAAPLNVEYTDWETRGKDGAVLRADLNQPVDLPSMQAAISFEPPVDNVKVSSTWSRGLMIAGDFASKATYTLKISSKAKNLTGDPVAADTIEFPLNESPQASGAGFDFEDKFYYPRRTAGVVPLQTRNVDEVTVSLSQLFPSNIQVALSSIDDGKTWDDFEGRWAKSIAEKKIKVNNTPDKRVTLPLDLKEMMPPDTRGVFGLRLSPGSNQFNTKIVVWTNIGLLAHWINDEIVVFAHDLFSLAPVPNAKITVWSAKNQLMASTTTDDQGIAQVRGLEKSLGQPSMVVVETGDDATFLRLAPRNEDAVPVKEDMPGYDRAGYDAFVYSDRGLYRPGEVIHAHWIGRTNYGDALPNVPLLFEVTNPKGSKVKSETITLSQLGTGGLDVQTDRAWMTGKYTLALKVPGKSAPVGSMQISLEDFVPNRIKTEVSLAAEQWMVQEEQKITLKAENLFGGPAADRKASGNVILRKGAFKPAAFAGFSFTNDAEYLAEVLPLGDTQTGADGMASFTFTWQGSPKISFPVDAVVRGEVSELGGRAVSDTKNVLLFASDKLLGVNVSKGGSADKIEVNVAAISPSGAPAAVPSVKVVVEREDWSYYVRRYSSYNEPNFSKSYVTVESKELPLANGRAAASFSLPEYSYGYFRVRVTSSTTPMVATQAFYKMWNGIETTDAPRPSLIKLTLDKEKYSVGDEARVRIESPFDGRAVVVLQGDAFHRVLTAEVKDGAGEVVFPLDAKSAPNVWAEATVVHVAPKERTQVYPYSSFAMINVPVQDPARRIDVAFPGLPEEVRPAQEVQVAIETRGADGAPLSAEVTVAAVDEGIHNILGYDNPDPWDYLQRSRRPDYRRAHYYDRVAYDFSPEAIGGDLAARLSKRSASIGDNWIKPVALWSGAITTDAEGKGTVTFSVPEFNGQLRLVAVAAGATTSGAGAKQLFVRRPYIMQTSIPRFALPGDSFTGRVNIFNTTAVPVSARVSWETAGALTGGPGAGSVEVPAGKDASVLATFQAAAAVGQGAIQWKAEIVDAAGAVLDTLAQEMPLPVRPPAAYQSRNDFAVLAPGETKTFSNAHFIDDEQVDMTLTVGNDPALRITKALKSLVGYPYGCVEQTTSRCMPLYLMRKSAALVEGTLDQRDQADAMVRAGIARLFNMQTATGGLGYWPGASEPNRYGSVYALHFLALVQRDREIPLPQDSLKALQDYVRLVGNETSDSSPSGLYLRAYAHYVLALNGDAEALKQIDRFNAIEMPTSARYLLAAALALNTNDTARVKEYLAKMPAQEFIDFERGGTLNSEIRNTAVKLLTLVQMKADEKELAPYVDTLTRYLGEARYYVTQEAAFVCAALGTYLNQYAKGLDDALVKVSSPDGERELKNGEHAVLRHKGPGVSFTVNNTGKASVYVNFASSGVPLQPELTATAEGVTIARAMQTADNQAKQDAVFTQGDTYIVRLDIDSPSELENVVLVDLLPAGFEIENPRLDDTQAATGEDSEEDVDDEGGEEDGGEDGVGAVTLVDDGASSSTPSYLDVRDDRLVLAFRKLPAGPHTYYYLVRAVTPGAYQQPGAVVECMYDAKIRANLLPATVEVK